MVGEVCNIGIAYSCLTEADSIILSEELNDFRWIPKEQISQFIENKAVLADIDKAEL